MRAVLLLIFTLVMCAVSPVLASSEIMDVDEESSLSPLDGSGVIIAVADTGIDMDHSCFRNSTNEVGTCLLYTSPSPRDAHESRMPSSA